MDCRADCSENSSLLSVNNDQSIISSLFLILPKDIIEIILWNLPLTTAINLACAFKGMNKRVGEARSAYSYQRESDQRIVQYTYRQVINALKQKDGAAKRIAAIRESHKESCYYVPSENRSCVQTTETIAMLLGGMFEIVSVTISASLILALSVPLILPLTICGAGTAAAACTTALGASSRFYTNRISREDKEMAMLDEQLKETEVLESKIKLKISGKEE